MHLSPVIKGAVEQTFMKEEEIHRRNINDPNCVSDVGLADIQTFYSFEWFEEKLSLKALLQSCNDNLRLGDTKDLL